MISLILIGAFCVFGIGLIAKFVLDKKEHELRITWPEFGIAAAILMLIVIPLTAWVGLKVAFQNSVTYNEFWSGYEVEAQWLKIKTSRDGAGRHKWDCDPYTVWVVDRPAYQDDQGNWHAEEGHYETRYHRCPYTTEEWTFVVKTTIGDYYIAENWLPTDPEQYRYRSPEGNSKRAPSHIDRGVPQFWLRVKDRIDANQPGPVTARKSYDNYILASDRTILKKYSADIDRYKQSGLFPKPNATVHDIYYADRVYFIGVQPPGDWQAYANNFDAALGMELQGDLHLIIVDANKISDPENYSGALFAYWQSPEFGRDAISKNSIMVILATEDGGKTVKWARAATGMPRGNERLLIAILDGMPGTPLDPQSVLGAPRGELVTDSTGKTVVRVIHSTGKLDQLIWGPDKFERVRMKDYSYLIHEIEPTTGQKAWIVFFIALGGCVAWGICIAYGPPTYRRFRGR